MKEKHTYHHVDASAKLSKALRANPYTVPNGYFENLRYRIVRECQKADDIPAAFGVPQGYFEQLTDGITAKIAEQKLKALVSDPGFGVPEGYFNQSAQLLTAVRDINKHASDTGFVVPERYFDKLTDRITEQATRQTTIPTRKLNRPKWVAYAAAASIALILGLTGMFRFADDASETKHPLASVSDQQILDYLELYGTADDVIYISEQFEDLDEQNIGKGISEEDIEAYLNHTL